MDVRFAAPADIPDLIRLRFDFFNEDPVLALTPAQQGADEAAASRLLRKALK